MNLIELRRTAGKDDRSVGGPRTKRMIYTLLWEDCIRRVLGDHKRRETKDSDERKLLGGNCARNVRSNN